MRVRIMAAALTALAVLVPGIGVAGASTGPAPTSAREAARQTPAPTTIRTRGSGQCLKAAGLGDGSAVLQIPCGGWGNESWETVVIDPLRSIYEIRNTASGRCLEIAGWSAEDNAAAMIWACHQGDNQRWIITQRGGVFEIRNLASNRCLDVRSTTSWIPVYQWGCHGGGEQQWLIP